MINSITKKITEQAYSSVVCIGNSKHYQTLVAELQSEWLHIIDPDAKQLNRMAESLEDENLTLTEKVITATEQSTATWYSTKPALYASSIKPNELIKRLPNLQIAEKSMPALNINKLFSDIEFGVNDNLLIMASNGAEAILLNAIEPQHLAKFATILVIAPQSLLYDINNVLPLAQFEQACFNMQSEVAGLFETTLFKQDKSKVEIKRLTLQYEKHIAEKNKLEADKKQLQTECLKLEGLNSELETEKNHFEARSSKLETQSSELILQISQLESEKKELAVSLNVEKEKAKLDKQAHQHTIQQLQSQLTEVKADSEQKQRHSELTQKLNAKAQIDLEHLRTQYQQKHCNERQLVDLINELRIKLQHAANFYHVLENKHPELLQLDIPSYVAEEPNLSNGAEVISIQDSQAVNSIENESRKNKTRKKRKRKRGSKK